MRNDKGYYTLEASIIVPFILVIVILFLSLIFTFFYKGYYETKLNAEVINKGYTLKDQELKRMEINVISHKKKTKVYQRKIDDHFLKGILLQDTIQFGKDWLDE